MYIKYKYTLMEISKEKENSKEIKKEESKEKTEEPKEKNIPFWAENPNILLLKNIHKKSSSEI